MGSSDPLWSILSDPTKQHGRWDLDEFMATGVTQMADVLARAQELDLPGSRETALDFGCGVGRVTRAMAPYFAKTVGVDVSQVMIDTAKRINAEVAGLEFTQHDGPDLAPFDDSSIDFLYCYIVLQHLPSAELVSGYLRDFMRILRPGGLLVFQLPDVIPLRRRIQPRRRAYTVLRRAGLPAATLRDRLGLHPIRMMAVGEAHVRLIIEGAKGRILEEDGDVGQDGISNRTYWVTRDPDD